MRGKWRRSFPLLQTSGNRQGGLRLVKWERAFIQYLPLSSPDNRQAPMTIHTTTQPKWYSRSHHDRYRTLNIVRHKWFRRPLREIKDIPNRTVHLDGRWINDVPSFYLSIGEAINGPGGYFGGDVNALDDCLNAGFGVRTPLTVRLSHYDEVRNALDSRAACRYWAEYFFKIVMSVDSGNDPVDKKRLDDAKYLVEFLSLTNSDSLRELLVDNGYLGDGSEADIAMWTSKYVGVLAGEPVDCDEYRPFFEVILEVFESRGASLIPENEDAS